MSTRILVLVIFLHCFSCSTEEELNAGSYQLFKKTAAWDLARAVRDEDDRAVREILTKDRKLIDFQEEKYGNTLLMLTVLNKQIKPFITLLSMNADINIHNTHNGASALILAARFQADDTKFVEALIERGANVNDIEVGPRRKSNGTRLTPLIAAVGGSLIFVELLVKKGANVNYQNEYGQSALTDAVLIKNREVVLFLLRNGADYMQPIFKRPGEDREMFLVDVLRTDFVELDSEEHVLKMEVVAFLGTKGIDYWATPIPDHIKEKAKEKYPLSWEDYLKKY